MLDGNDRQTFYALRELRDVAGAREKPLIIWAGAGVSAWCGLPTWREAAERVHKSFLRHESSYDKHEGLRLLEGYCFPELFELCRNANGQRYRRELASLFTFRMPTPVYGRFIEIVKQIAPLHIVTTNVDESLERSLQNVAIVQRSDLERCQYLTQTSSGFVAKLHGSIGAVESTVFTSSDYRALEADAHYVEALRQLFAQSTLVFIGYSLRDKYVVDILDRTNQARPLFGDGPHFVIRSVEQPSLPGNIRTIRYLPEPHTDHRSAITVLDVIRATREEGRIWFAPEAQPTATQDGTVSAYFISDVVPPGTWTSSQSLILGGREGLQPNALVGQGFDDTEIPDKSSHAAHDVAVGLIAFERLYFPISCVSKLHGLFGSEMFWELVRARAFCFIHFEQQPTMMFRSAEAVAEGDIGMCRVAQPDGSPPTIDTEIRKQVTAVPGRETEAERLFDDLKAAASAFDHVRFNVPNLTRGALLHPSVRRLLGLSDALPPTSIPRWSCFPVIRLAHTILAGCACGSLTLPAVKLGFGGEVLVGAAFGVCAARDWAANVSSYVLAGRFNADLGAYIESDPSILRAILSFRETQAGADLRREILQELAVGAGRDFVGSVNGGLRQTIPTAVMENARDQLSGLLFRNPTQQGVPAVWTNLSNADASISLWRARSMRELDAYCKSRGIRDKSLCPCGSGEKLRDCCRHALAE